MTKAIATIALGAASLGLVAACGGGGNGGTSTQRAVVGGKPIATKSGQRVQALKLLEEPSGTSTRGKFILLSGQICNTRREGFAPKSRFSLELDHKRTVRPDPNLRTSGNPAVLSATSGMATPNGGCIDGWDAFGVNATDRVTAVIFTPDVRHPGANQVRLALPAPRTPPPTQFPGEEPSAPPSSSPTATTAASAKVGDELTLNTGSFSNPPNQSIAVTVTRVVDPAESEGSVQPGNRGVAVQLRYVNHGSGLYNDSVGNEVQLIDQLGQGFAASVVGTKAGPNFPSGSVRLGPGETALGFVGFNVPTGSTIVKVRVTLQSGYGDSGDWAVG